MWHKAEWMGHPMRLWDTRKRKHDHDWKECICPGQHNINGYSVSSFHKLCLLGNFAHIWFINNGLDSIITVELMDWMNAFELNGCGKKPKKNQVSFAIRSLFYKVKRLIWPNDWVVK